MAESSKHVGTLLNLLLDGGVIEEHFKNLVDDPNLNHDQRQKVIRTNTHALRILAVRYAQGYIPAVDRLAELFTEDAEHELLTARVRQRRKEHYDGMATLRRFSLNTPSS